MERSRRVQPLPDWGLLASADGVWEAEPGPGKKKEGGRGKAREAEPQDALRQPGDRNPSRTCFYPPHINLLPTWQACSEQSKRVPWHVGQLESSPPLSSPPLPCDILRSPAMMGSQSFQESPMSWIPQHQHPQLPLWTHREPPEEAVPGQLGPEAWVLVSISRHHGVVKKGRGSRPAPFGLPPTSMVLSNYRTLLPKFFRNIGRKLPRSPAPRQPGSFPLYLEV